MRFLKIGIERFDIRSGVVSSNEGKMIAAQVLRGGLVRAGYTSESSTEAAEYVLGGALSSGPGRLGREGSNFCWTIRGVSRKTTLWSALYFEEVDPPTPRQVLISIAGAKKRSGLPLSRTDRIRLGKARRALSRGDGRR